MPLILVTTSLAITVGATTTVSHGLSLAPNWTTLLIRSNSTTMQAYVIASNSLAVFIMGTGGIAAAVCYVDAKIEVFHSIIQ